VAGLERVRAVPYSVDTGVQLGEAVLLGSQERSYALSVANVARITLARTDVDLAWVQPAARWAIESDLQQPLWAGYVDALDEDEGGEYVELTLVDPVGAVLEDTRSAKELVLQRTAGEALRQLLAEQEAWSPTGLSLGRVDAGPFVEEALKATSLQHGLEQLTAVSPGYDWWVLTRNVGGALAGELNWGRAGRDRRGDVLRSGIEIKQARQVWKRSGLVRSVTVVGQHAQFAQRAAVELLTAGQGKGDVPAVSSETSVQTNGPAGRRELVAVMNQEVSPEALIQRAETILLRTLELAHTLELELHLTNTTVQTIGLGDRFSVSVPSLMLGAGLEGVVRVLGLEPHEEDGRLDAIVTVEEVTPV